MTLSAVLLEGLRRAALSAALLSAAAVPLPAAPQPPVPPLAVDGSVADSGLTLTAHALDVHVSGEAARVRASLHLRNDRSSAVAVQYLLPYPARLAQGDFRAAAFDDEALCDDADLPPAVAESIEALPVRIVREREVIVVGPGESVSVEFSRRVAIESAGDVRRLRLPLPVDRDAPWVPRFVADVQVDAERPIRRLGSPTHSVLVDGLGGRTALLSVQDGFVYRQAQLVIEFELDAEAAPPLALEKQSRAKPR